MLSWILTNWQELLLVGTGVVTGASIALRAVSKITANKTDDQVAGWLEKAVPVLEKLSLNSPGKKLGEDG